jgi:hypothetical protein
MSKVPALGRLRQEENELRPTWAISETLFKKKSYEE